MQQNNAMAAPDGPSLLVNDNRRPRAGHIDLSGLRPVIRKEHRNALSE
jgi:hypothetical protein